MASPHVLTKPGFEVGVPAPDVLDQLISQVDIAVVGDEHTSGEGLLESLLHVVGLEVNGAGNSQGFEGITINVVRVVYVVGIEHASFNLVTY